MELSEYIKENVATVEQLASLRNEIQLVIDICTDALRDGNTIFFCGNGGSAADAQHFAAEFLGRFLIDRKPLPSVALTVDTSALTAIGNDYGFEKIFSRQLIGLGKKGDVLIGLSTSGNSGNVVEAFKAARQMQIHTVSMTGETACALDSLSDVALKVASIKTNFVQEAHFVIGHYICLIVEKKLCANN